MHGVCKCTLLGTYTPFTPQTDPHKKAPEDGTSIKRKWRAARGAQGRNNSLNCRNSETCHKKAKSPFHDHLEYLLIQKLLSGWGLGGGMKQWKPGSHLPPHHRYMVIATTLIVQCYALLHCSANQTSAECRLEFTTRGGHRMFRGLPHALWLVKPCLPLSPAALTIAVQKKSGLLPLPPPPAQKPSP